MNHDNNNNTSLKEIEQELFGRLQHYFHVVFKGLLEDMDSWIMENRDHARYKYKEKQETSMDTVFGSVVINRRKYQDREKGARVALLDQYLQFKGDDSLSPYLAELAVDWAVRGPSYRDARDRLQQLLGYQAMSHEQIRQKVQQVQGVDHSIDEEEREKADALFLEVDGINPSLQGSKKGRHEVKVGIAHEGWEKRHPRSKDYDLKNKSFYYSLENGESFWEGFSRSLYEQYDIQEDTPIVINGDGAPWIRGGMEFLPQAIYNYDRFHLEKWIKMAMSNRSKKERRKAYVAGEANDPAALVTAVAEAEKAETDDKKREEIETLRTFILNNQEAFRDYRKRLREQGFETDWMRTMGSAESNMNFFSRRLKKMGYSWSLNGLDAMVRSMIHRFDGTLEEALQIRPTSDHEEEKSTCKKPSIAKVLKQKTKQSVGAITGNMPLLQGREPGSYTAQALRGLAGLQADNWV